MEDKLVGKIMMIRKDLTKTERGKHVHMTQKIFSNLGMVGKVVEKYYDRPIYRLMIKGQQLQSWIEEDWLVQPLIDNRRIVDV